MNGVFSICPVRVCRQSASSYKHWLAEKEWWDLKSLRIADKKNQINMCQNRERWWKFINCLLKLICQYSRNLSNWHSEGTPYRNSTACTCYPAGGILTGELSCLIFFSFLWFSLSFSPSLGVNGPYDNGFNYHIFKMSIENLQQTSTSAADNFHFKK